MRVTPTQCGWVQIYDDDGVYKMVFWNIKGRFYWKEKRFLKDLLSEGTFNENIFVRNSYTRIL